MAFSSFAVQTTGIAATASALESTTVSKIDHPRHISALCMRVPGTCTSRSQVAPTCCFKKIEANIAGASSKHVYGLRRHLPTTIVIVSLHSTEHCCQVFVPACCSLSRRPRPTASGGTYVTTAASAPLETMTRNHQSSGSHDKAVLQHEGAEQPSAQGAIPQVSRISNALPLPGHRRAKPGVPDTTHTCHLLYRVPHNSLKGI